MSQSIAKIKDVCEFVRGLTYSKNDEVDFSRNAVLRATNIDLNSKKLNLNDIRYIDDSVTVKADKKVKVNDILICTASGSKSHLGKVAFIEEQIDMAFGGFMGVLRAKPNINPKYLFSFLKSDIFLHHVFNTSDGANINNLKFSQFEDLDIALPSLPIQQKIVEKLDSIFSEIDRATVATQANIKNTEALFQSYLRKIFEGGGEDWRNVRLGDVCDFQNGFAFKSNLFTETGLPILRISNIQNQIIDSDNLVFFNLESYKEKLEKYIVEPNDLLIAMSGATTGKIGFNKTNQRFYLNQRVGNLKPKRDLNKNYLYYFLSTQVEKNLSISAGAAQPNLSTEQIKEMLIPLPSISTQERIIEKFNAISAEIDKSRRCYKNKGVELSFLKQSILKQAFNGELVKE